MLGIWIYGGLIYFYAILEQENWEWWFRRKWQAIISTPLHVAATVMAINVASDDLAVWLLILNFFAFVAGFVLSHRGPIGRQLSREMELEGHLREAVYANKFYGADFDDYLRSEAEVMAVSYDWFEDWSADEVEQAMRDMLPDLDPVKRHKDHTENPPYPFNRAK